MTVIRRKCKMMKLSSRKGVVGAAGLEPALIAETDFESPPALLFSLDMTLREATDIPGTGRESCEDDMSEWTMKAVGRSFDNRTNVWQIRPACGHRPFSPQTSMYAHQRVECPVCRAEAICDYNAGTIAPATP